MARGKRAPGNQDEHRTIELFFTPYTEGTYVGANVAWTGSRSYERRVLSRWRIDVARTDLAGLRPDAVLRVLCLGLVRCLEPFGAWSYTYPLTAPTAEGIGAPLGATGGTVSGQMTLPGM